MKTALTIAGSDSCGGAGIQVDLRVFAMMGVHGASAITAITAQNTLGVRDAMLLPPALVANQIDTVAVDLDIHATKTGMLGDAAIIAAVADAVARNELRPLVCDPVMVAKSGDPLLRDDAVESMKKLLFPLATIVTPNRREAAALIGADPASLTTVAAAGDAARRIAAMGASAVVVKAIEAGGRMVDVLFDGRDCVEIAGPLQPAGRNHGSGCAFAAAIAAALALGRPLADAVSHAKQLVNRAIERAQPLGHGTLPVNVLGAC